jgi:hypothetical protein
MPIFIGVVSGLLDGLGISLFYKGEMLLGAAWFLTGLATAFVLYMRVRENEKAAQPVVVNRRDRRP